MKKYIVTLNDEERKCLNAVVNKGSTKAYRLKHALILLSADTEGANQEDAAIARTLRCHRNTVANVRQRFVEKGLEAALERKIQETPRTKPVLDGESEAKLIALACGPAPQGRSHWTMQLLADRMIEMQIVEKISDTTVQRALKKRFKAASAKMLGYPT